MRRRSLNRRQSMIVSSRPNLLRKQQQSLMLKIEPAEQYLKTFHWNKVKYRADKPLGEIIDTLQKVAPTQLLKF